MKGVARERATPRPERGASPSFLEEIGRITRQAHGHERRFTSVPSTFSPSFREKIGRRAARTVRPFRGALPGSAATEFNAGALQPSSPLSAALERVAAGERRSVRLRRLAWWPRLGDAFVIPCRPTPITTPSRTAQEAWDGVSRVDGRPGPYLHCALMSHPLTSVARRAAANCSAHAPAMKLRVRMIQVMAALPTLHTQRMPSAYKPVGHLCYRLMQFLSIGYIENRISSCGCFGNRFS